MIAVETLNGYFKSIKEVVSYKHIVTDDGLNGELFHVNYKYDGRPCSFLVLIPRWFPNIKPVIALDFEVNTASDFPHLMRNGAICYADDEGLLLDESNPAGVIRDALFKASKTIFQSVEGQSKEDYIREFDYYWRGQNRVTYAKSICGKLAKPVIVLAVTLENGKLFIGQGKDELENYLTKVGQNWIKDSWEELLYIPLVTNHGISFLNRWDVTTVRSIILGNIGFKERVFRHLRYNKNLPVYLTMPADNSSQIHFAVRFDKVRSRKHPLLEKKKNFGITPIAIDRMDKEYLIKRGGGSMSLITKKVAIIGAGAIGGIISVELAKAGVASLVLVDQDILEAENVLRHVLGINDGVGKYKVSILKERIENSIPHCKVSAIPKRFEDLGVSDIDFSQIDLVINCTGVENIGFIINKKLWPKNASIHTWVEPMGIGGHALLSLGNGESGCFKCLFGYDHDEGLYNKASFVKPGQRFSKSMFGCAGMFTPFSSLDTLKTGVLALELALSFLHDKGTENMPQSQLLSWKGSDSQVVAEGFKVSSRFDNMSNNELLENRHNFINEECTICSKKMN